MDKNKWNFAILFSITILLSSINVYGFDKTKNSSCYGFIIPNYMSTNKTYENHIYCKTRNLINDLLDQNITVFWTAKRLNASVKKLKDSRVVNLSFEKGSFVIPLTENDSINKKLICIVCDYNDSSEIDRDKISIPTFMLINP